MTRKGLTFLSAAFLLLSTAAFACVVPTNNAVQEKLAQDLAKYPGINVKVDDCVATLSGSVDKYQDKLNAAKKAHSFGALTNVVNNIAVAGPTVADDVLQKKLATDLAYDRTFFGNVFDWFTVDVTNGAVTLGGYAHNPIAHESALAIVQDMKGVKDVTDQVEVLPTSMIDDGIRIQAARLIYGGTSFAGSMDPAHPIRIIVENGNVKLEGVVISPLDKQMAYMKVMGMPGVFSVENDLLVKKG